MRLVRERESRKKRDRERLRRNTIKTLRVTLRRLIPNSKVYVYGSITKPFKFNNKSDIDIALVVEPSGKSIYLLHTLLEESLGRSVDLSLLFETRLKNKIMKEGSLWMT